MSKATVLIAATAGYVLGARAGRGRYEQIRSAALKVWGNPTVQDKVSVLEDKATDAARAAASTASQKAGDAAKAAASTVADKVRHRGGDAGEPAPQGTVTLDTPTTTTVNGTSTL
ncbi:YtxH domain-containing protein [Kineococcus glutinatus]|uniref:YtxH-like protein n=1 Tax=Kineococcus glutinatus TaxID=1070872 RepID=A0ABP8VEX0_9ACTN